MRLTMLLFAAALACCPAVAQTPDASAAPLWEGKPCPPRAPVPARQNDTPLPSPVSRTASIDYPPAMMRRGIEASCIAMFDVGSDGAPVNVAARCSAAKDAETTPEISQSEETFVLFSRRVVGCLRYAAADDPSWAGKWRSNLRMNINWTMPDHLGPPDEADAFARPGAEPMSAEQVAYYADRRTKENEGLAAWRIKMAARKAEADAKAAAARDAVKSKSKPNP